MAWSAAPGPAARQARTAKGYQGDCLMLRNALFGGINAAVVTAMNADLSIDLDRMAAHSRWLLANGCNNLGVLGTTGEANSIGISERLELLPGLIGGGVPAVVRCCCHHSITKTRPRMACSRFSRR